MLVAAVIFPIHANDHFILPPPVMICVIQLCLLKKDLSLSDTDLESRNHDILAEIQVIFCSYSQLSEIPFHPYNTYVLRRGSWIYH